MNYIRNAKAPAAYVPPGVKSAGASIAALEGQNISFYGYGIAEGELIQFLTEDEYKSLGSAAVLKITRNGAKRSSHLVRVGRSYDGGKTWTDTWFNVGLLTRQDANRNYIQDHPTMAKVVAGADAYAQLTPLFGKTIKGYATVTATMPSISQDETTGMYRRDKNPDGSLATVEQQVVKVQVVDVPKSK